MRRLANWLANRISPTFWHRIELHAKRRRLGARVPADVIARVRSKKALYKSMRQTYTHQPQLGVIVTSFNQRWNVESLAERLVTNPNITEIIVCEDGSLDGSLEAWVSRLMGPNHFLIRSNDLHEIRILDRALRLSRAEVCCVIQDDDVIPGDPAWASHAMALFDRYPRLGVLGGFIGYDEPPAEAGLDGEPNLSFLDHKTIEGDEFKFVPTVCIGPYYVRAACYESCGGFDLSFSAPGQAGVGFDEEFGLRAWLNGWQVGYLHQPFKTGIAGEYEQFAGGTGMYGDPSERTTHDVDNKRKIATTYGKHHDEIAEYVRQSNASRVIHDGGDGLPAPHPVPPPAATRPQLHDAS